MMTPQAYDLYKQCTHDKIFAEKKKAVAEDNNRTNELTNTLDR